MTSIAVNSSAPQAPTTNASISSARASSVSSGQTASAAVQASAPAPRASYANAVANPKKPPTGPGAASSPSNPASQVSGGVSGQHARSASTTSVPVNGKIQPAVPQIGNSGNTLANGASTPFSGGQHSRKSSIATGAMPNGALRAPTIKFGALDGPGSGPQSGTAVAAGNLTAPVAQNPRASSPSPSAASQPAASGGAPPSAGPARSSIQFGDTTPQQRPMSLPPQPHHPPQGPGSMGRGHNRHDSAQSETAHNMSHGRGMPQANRGGRHPPYQQNQYQQQQQQQQQYGYAARGGYHGGPNQHQQRGGPATMGAVAPYSQPPFPNSPRGVPRSPALPHVSAHQSPSMANAVPITTQLYPPSHGQQYIPQGNSQYPPQAVFFGESFNAPPHQYTMGYLPYAQTSPRPGYSQAVAQMSTGGYYQQQPTPMSRSGSQNHDIHRPPSSIGQHGHHGPPQMNMPPQHMIPPPQPSTPVHNAPYRAPPPKKNSKAVPIKNPETQDVFQPPPTVPSAPVIVASPGAPPASQAGSRRETHSRSTSRGTKTDDEKRQEMRQKVMLLKVESEKIEKEERRLQQEAQAKKAAEEEKQAEAEKAEKEERRLQEEAAKAKKAAEEEAERLRKIKEEVEAKAAAEAEAKAKKEAEEKAKAAAEAEAKAKKEAEERAAKEAEERAAKEAEEKAAKEAEEAKAKAEAEAAKAAAEAKAEAEKAAALSSATTPAETPAITPKLSTPDGDSMPPPSLKTTEKPRSKPSPLNLQIQTTEPALPSAQLTALRSARPVDNLKGLQYPEGIASPNPALNPLATATKFKYDKDFLMQFQVVFTEKPSVDWDQRMRETVGDTESPRPSAARTPSGLASRSSSSRGLSSYGGTGTMGQFSGVSVGAGPKAAGMTSMERFKQSTPNPLASMGVMGPMPRPGGGIVRANSSTSLAGSVSSGLPQSPRTGNRSARGSKRGITGNAPPMERSESRQQPSQPTMPPIDVKPLPVSANRWTPRSLKAAATESAPAAPGAGSADSLMSPELVQRKVKAALNKMTPEKFDKISDQILDITGQSKYESDGRTLRQVIQLTFEKATDEAHWASMYAKFCKRMLETMDPSIKDEGIRDKNGVVVTGGNLFRKYLLNRCQEEFERGWKVNLPPQPDNVDKEVAMLSDEYYIAAAAKRRGLGLVQFIGELFKLNMLTERIMNECVRKLLEFEGLPEDETVESLCKLLRTIGRQLDSSEKSQPIMDMYFHRISTMSEHKDLNSRMRFMLMDIIDLRKRRWESNEKDKGPKTIQEVREEALKAQQEKEASAKANRNSRPQAGRGDASFSSGGYGGAPPPQYHDNKAATTVNPDDLAKWRTRSRQSASSVQPSFGPNTSFLGPRGSGSRRGLANRDDSGSRGATPPVPPPSTSSSNMFSALQEAHHDGNDATSPPPSKANSPQVSNAKLAVGEA